MSNADATTSPAVPPPERVLRKLFLTLFLRGRAARHSARAKQKLATMSVARKLWLSLAGYAFLGLMALTFIGQSLVAMALYLHALTFVLVGMYVVTSAGEVLFNKEEADILLHRPVAPRDLLRARIAMLVYVSLWMAAAFNLVGLFAGMGAPDGDWRFPLVHAASISLEALFTTATVVVVYQLCLRWFGRERLDALMTTTQVVLAIVVVVGAQIVPQLMIRMEGQAITRVDHWWAVLVPPAWFAGIDDALAGSGSARAWLLAAIALVATAALVWVALVRMAADYGAGMQTVAESSGQTAARRRQRWLHRLVHKAPLRWWLRDSVSRASFLLAAAYLARDRDVKLRVWPGLAPLMVLPLIMLLTS